MRLVEFSNNANNELRHAWEWYEDQMAGLGDRFYDEIMNKVEVIQQHPERFPTRSKNFREAIIKTFPYLIIYYCDNKSIIISSIFHTSRDPKKKYRKRK